MITYAEISAAQIMVRLDGKHVGDIRQNRNNGWFYYKPKGAPRGQEMGTVAEIKSSLEEEA